MISRTTPNKNGVRTADASPAIRARTPATAPRTRPGAPPRAIGRIAHNRGTLRAMARTVPVGPAHELSEQTPRLVVHRGVPYCITRVGDEVHAFVATCSHKDLALVPLRLKKGRLVCPHHGATFDPQTGAVVEDRGKTLPCGLPPVELTTREDGVLCLLARKRHRKLLGKHERRRVSDAAESAAVPQKS
jgi:3-phenylpropionate/trans-cinnamate dioxygenase ferredoxin component